MGKKRKISKLYASLMRNNWGNIIKCFWNQMIIDEIKKVKKN